MKLLTTYKRYNILLATNKDRYFYSDMGRFFCNKVIIKELEGPIYDDAFHYWLLAKDGNTVIAFASWTTEKTPVMYFGIIWVEPKYRRKGLARELFRLRMQCCIEQGATVLKASANLLSRGMHLAEGWVMTSQRGQRWGHFEKCLDREETA